MGKGIDLARAEAPLHAQVLDDFKDQLLIVLLRRLGPKVRIPVSEVDAPGRYVVAMGGVDDEFRFEVKEKQ